VAIVFTFVVSVAHVACAQTAQPSPWFTRVGFTPAWVVATNPFAVDNAPWATNEIHSAPNVTVEIGRQTDGSRDWHRLYGFPSYGVGMSVTSFGGGTVSRPVDAYTFFSWPFADLTDRLQVVTDFGMGISWNWKALNRETNSYTTVLGSDLNARVDWGFYLRYIATPQTSLYAGIDYTHRSNGGMRQPDLGINVVGPRVALRYNIDPQHHPIHVSERTAFRPAWEFVAGGTGGLKNVVETSRPELRGEFAALNFTAGVQRHFYRFGKVATGADVTYDAATVAQVERLNAINGRPGAPAGSGLAVGLYGGYEHVIGRFGALVQLGYRITTGSADPNASRIYERYGWRYHVNDNFWTMFSVRAIDGWRADFMEFGAGYKTRW
jgi:hypothetical protein